MAMPPPPPRELVLIRLHHDFDAGIPKYVAELTDTVIIEGSTRALEYVKRDLDTVLAEIKGDES